MAEVDAAVRQARHRIVVGLENEPVRADEIHRGLTATLAREEAEDGSARFDTELGYGLAMRGGFTGPNDR